MHRRSLKTLTENVCTIFPFPSTLKIGLWLVAVLAIGLRCVPAAAQPDPLASFERQILQLVDRVEPSVVVIVRGRNGMASPATGRMAPFGVLPEREGLWNGFPRPEDPDFVPERFGAGVIIEDDNGKPFILTMAHLVRGGPVAGNSTEGAEPQLYVKLADGRGAFATIHASDPRSDLAVLRLDSTMWDTADQRADPTPAIRLSEKAGYLKGQLIFVFGNPYATARDGSASIAWGIVGNVSRKPAPSEQYREMGLRSEASIHDHGTLLQLDCRLPLGVSGGPVVDRTGQLIGLTTSLAALEGYESTTGFAVPIDPGIRRVIATLLKGQEVEYGLLGVTPVDLNANELPANLPGRPRRSAVRADGVKSGSPAFLGGLRAGDVILAVDGQQVFNVGDLMKFVGYAGPGTVVALDTVRPRDGMSSRTARVRLGKWPVVNDKEFVATVPRFSAWHGIVVDHATAREKYLPPRLEPYPHGVVVLAAEVAREGTESVRPGDFIVSVDDVPLETPTDFYNHVQGKGSARLRLADGREFVVPPPDAPDN